MFECFEPLNNTRGSYTSTILNYCTDYLIMVGSFMVLWDVTSWDILLLVSLGEVLILGDPP